MLARRRFILKLLGILAGIVGLLTWRWKGLMGKDSIVRSYPIGFQWETQDPFLFCAYHRDLYPQGNGSLGPVGSLDGRQIGQDFEVKDGFRMYHGDQVPGFPVHPHRGFETITIVREGLVDHADSLGAAGRYSNGDVQWMTAGKGIQHSEMFPLVQENKDNPLELFQVWLNLPRKSKMVDPHYTMFWNEKLSRVQKTDGRVKIDVIAGSFEDTQALAPPPQSWAADPKNGVTIWVIEMEKDSELRLPPAKLDLARTLYFYSGKSLDVDKTEFPEMSAVVVDAKQSTHLKASHSAVKMLVLQGRAIEEPVAQHGPFVMNTREEIYQTIHDYQATKFGGWKWDRSDMVHGKTEGRFAKYSDGKEERPS